MKITPSRLIIKQKTQELQRKNVTKKKKTTTKYVAETQLAE